MDRIGHPPRGTPDEEPAPTGRSLRQAVVTALILLALVIVFNLLGPGAFFFLAAAVVLIALFELLDALRTTGRNPSTAVALAGAAGMLVALRFERPLIFVLVAAATIQLVLILALRASRGSAPATDAAWTLLAIAWIGGGGSGAVAILSLGEYPALLLTAFVLATALSDIGAYFAGTYLGRHKMAPNISPAKSWEGYAGGVAAALAGGALFGVVLPDLNALTGLGLGFVGAALGPLGDLVESLVKRELRIKDSGRLLPGHGGLLDRVDAIVFTAPAAYLYLTIVVP